MCVFFFLFFFLGGGFARASQPVFRRQYGIYLSVTMVSYLKPEFSTYCLRGK